jgi:copper(I)-binding protein
MKFRWIFAAVILAALFSFSLVSAQGDESCEVAYLFDAWARPSPAGAPNGAVFGLLVNLSAEEDTLVSASTGAAEAVEFHETIMGENDVMQMRPVEGGFEVDPRSFLELQPGGLHMMLINLTEPLEAGGTVDLILNFERAGEVQVSVPVREEEMPGEMDMEETGVPMMEVPAMDWGEACAKIHVLDPWARPAVPGMPNSAAYGLILNLTDEDETLVSASTDAAEAAELHEMVMGDNDVMQMRPIEGGILVPAGSAVLLKPGGLHVMLIGLTAELQAGETIDLMLTFAEAGELEIEAPIREPEEGGMNMGGMQVGGEHEGG